MSFSVKLTTNDIYSDGLNLTTVRENSPKVGWGLGKISGSHCQSSYYLLWIWNWLHHI